MSELYFYIFLVLMLFLSFFLMLVLVANNFIKHLKCMNPQIISSEKGAQ